MVEEAVTVPEDTAVSGAGDTQVNDVVDGEVNGNGNGDDVVGAGMTTEKIIPESDLGLPDRRIWVVTTASLPWRTGTAVNPLARALYLTKGRPADYVTLLIPWLTHKEDQTKLFGADCTFESEEDQAKWIREYCMNRVLAGSDEEAKKLRIRFYPARYVGKFGSIFATEDICALIPKEEADVAILEEPEHLTWFRVPPKVDKEDDKSDKEMAELGWSVKFNYVVGILHTNYSAYMNQYGMAASFIAARALTALSSMVVRAYCDKLIRLSATLPELDAAREVTCNVHGVRSEFFDTAPAAETEVSSSEFAASQIYFIGKLMWAKGFDKLLEIEELYRKENGEYFGVDIYGSGSDQKAITRAFHGRKGIIGCVDEKRLETSGSGLEENDTNNPTGKVFAKEGSLRSQLENGEEPAAAVAETATEERNVTEVRPSDSSETSEDGDGEKDATNQKLPNPPNLLAIVRDLSTRTVDLGIGTTLAGAKLGELVANIGFHAAFTESKQKQTGDASRSTGQADDSKDDELQQKFRFDPVKSRFEFRKHPVPATFRGVMDHAKIRHLPGHKVFLNPSETEVLCTTTAEALAMQKFVIIPKHPSNEFFLQFPNCLAYSTMEECVEKIQYAQQHDPTPLSDELLFLLSWEGANQRLIEASKQTTKDVEDEQGGRMPETLARLHVETVKRGQLVHRLFRR